MSDTTFSTVFRGYDPAEVEYAIHQLKAGQASALQEAAQKSVEITKLQASSDSLAADLAAMRSRVEEFEAASSEAAPPSYADLGPRITQILTLAEDEARELVASAKADVTVVTSEAAATADETRNSADAYATEKRSQADAQAAKVIELAKRDADDLIDHAEREASARRGEAEALFESQRAKSAAAAADFEKTLASRRDKAAAEFQVLMGNHEASLAAAEEKLSTMQAEAVRVMTEAEAEAVSVREAAQHEATHLIEAARTNAERVRRDSERELAALASRRDSITGQLANVRQMLATLGGASLAQVEALAQEHTEEPSSSDEVAEGSDAPVEFIATVDAPEEGAPTLADDADVVASEETRS